MGKLFVRSCIDSVDRRLTFRFGVAKRTRKVFCTRMGSNILTIRPCRCFSESTVFVYDTRALFGLTRKEVSPVLTFAANGLGIRKGVSGTLHLGRVVSDGGT